MFQYGHCKKYEDKEQYANLRDKKAAYPNKFSLSNRDPFR